MDRSQYNWGRTLQTGCTVRVAPGMHVVTNSAGERRPRRHHRIPAHQPSTRLPYLRQRWRMSPAKFDHGIMEAVMSRFNFGRQAQNDKKVFRLAS